MIDRTYQQALEATEPPHLVILGPLTCQGCGRLVEWAGVAWLDAGRTTRHNCPPLGARILAARSNVAPRLYPALPAYRSDQAHLMRWWPTLDPVMLIGAVAFVLAIVASLGGWWLLAQLVQAVRGG